MKTKTPHVLTLGAALLLAPLTSALAQSTWKTVDALTPWLGRAIVADDTGNFISLALDDSTSSAGPVSTVSSSSDGGATWKTVGSIAGYAGELALAHNGALFASGNRTATVSGRAVVWESLDHGVTWTQSDPWAGQTTTFICLDVAAGNSGAVYLCGYISRAGRWVVRKGQPTSSGITWTTADNIPGFQPESIWVRPVTQPGQADEVLVCGQGVSGLWTVRRSLDGAATWTTIDSFYVSSQSYHGVTTGPGGSIYAVGRIYNAGTYGWLVRKSANDGATWANVDFFPNGWPTKRNVAVDKFGRVFVVGFNSTTPYTWLVRASIDGGATWFTTDSFLPSGDTTSQAWGVASDGLGNVCVVGEASNSTGASSDVAPTRRLAAP